MTLIRIIRFATLGTALVACTGAVSGSGAFSGPGVAFPPAVEAAIVQSVRARMGADAEVRVEGLQSEGLQDLWRPASPRQGSGQAAGPTNLVAIPEPGSRAGGDVKFTLHVQRRRVGSAVARITVVAAHARAARNVSRGARIAADDLSSARADVGRSLLKPLPAADQLIGAPAVRDLHAGEIVTQALARVAPLVRSGDTVATRVVVGAIEARGEAVAAQSGAHGDVIRLVNRATRRAMRGRVTGAGEVEVIR